MVVDELSKEFNVCIICSLMGVSRSGYYKRKKRKPSETEMRRKEMLLLVDSVHLEHPSHGYRWTAAFIRLNHNLSVSDGYIYKSFQILVLKAETMHKRKMCPRREKDRFPNLIYSTWERLDSPREVIVSDMRAFRVGSLYAKITFYFDVFTKEILTYRVTDRRGSRDQYIDGLQDVLGMQKAPEIL